MMSVHPMFGFELRALAVWTPGEDDAAPPLKEIPPLLRRRADAMGRAALHVMTRPELPYEGQPIIMCSRLGEFQRAFELQAELAREGSESPQQFSMAVHNAIGGLFLMAKKSRAPLTALAAGEEGALAGLQEAAAQLADGAEKVWLLFCEERLGEVYRPLTATAQEGGDWFAFVLELAPGSEFRLDVTPDADTDAGARAASPLELLDFLRDTDADAIRLSPRAGWILQRGARTEN